MAPTVRGGLHMPTPIQEEPESTIGKRPDRLKRSEPEQGRTRSGTALRRDGRSMSSSTLAQWFERTGSTFASRTTSRMASAR